MPYGSFTNHPGAPSRLWQELLLRPHRRPLGHHYGPIGFSLQRWRIQAQQLPAPPRPGRAFFRHAREPVLLEDRTDLSRRFLVSRRCCEEGPPPVLIVQTAALRVLPATL